MEYTVNTLPKDVLEMRKVLGENIEEGWELVSVVQNVEWAEGQAHSAYLAFYKKD